MSFGLADGTFDNITLETVNRQPPSVYHVEADISIVFLYHYPEVRLWGLRLLYNKEKEEQWISNCYANELEVRLAPEERLCGYRSHCFVGNTGKQTGLHYNL